MADNIDALSADFDSYHIEGIAAASNQYFKAPLISEILPGLWQGGCIDGVRLPDDFDLEVSLYPWERYVIGPDTERVEIKAYDNADVPDLTGAVDLAYEAWKSGKKVLINCQAGLNRSGLVAAQVLMRDDYTASDAIQLLRDKRSPVVLCNKHFVNWLMRNDTNPE